MDKVEAMRKFLADEYNIKTDKELIEALAKCKFIERGFLRNGAKCEE